MSLPKTDFDKIELWAFYGLMPTDRWGNRFLMLPYEKKGKFIKSAIFNEDVIIIEEELDSNMWAQWGESSYAKKGYYGWSEKAREAIRMIFLSGVEFILH